jgi:nucleoside-diphosphate-sugar epimerase
MSILVTGSAGFIGHHVALALLERGERVIGLDNLNDYYDPALKLARNARLQDRAGKAATKRYALPAFAPAFPARSWSRALRASLSAGS